MGGALSSQLLLLCNAFVERRTAISSVEVPRAPIVRDLRPRKWSVTTHAQLLSLENAIAGPPVPCPALGLIDRQIVSPGKRVFVVKMSKTNKMSLTIKFTKIDNYSVTKFTCDKPLTMPCIATV